MTEIGWFLAGAGCMFAALGLSHQRRVREREQRRSEWQGLIDAIEAACMLRPDSEAHVTVEFHDRPEHAAEHMAREVISQARQKRGNE